MSLTLILFLIFLGLLSFHIFVRYSRQGRLTSKVPGPTPYPFIGNMLSFNISSPEDLWESVRYVSKNWYPIGKVWCSTCALFSIRHPDDLEILLTSPKAITKGWTYDYLHPWLKTGLLTSTGEKWKERRRILTPAFHFNIINKYMTIAEEQGEKMINNLRDEGKETVKSLIPFCSQMTLNIICESAMGIDLNKMDVTMMRKYIQALHKLGNIVVYRMPRPYLTDWMLKLLRPFWKLMRETNESLIMLHKFTDKIVKERKQYHENTNYRYLQGFTDDDDECVDSRYMGGKKRLAMLDLLISAEREGLMDEAGIKEEVDTFTFEGHDTTSMAMVYTLMLLAENKEEQDLARVEVTEVINKSNGKFGVAQIQECNYLERCIKESLRLYPPVSTIFRHTAKDSEIQLKHALLPAGSHCIIHFYDVHRDPNYWPEPEKFDPDRFLPERSKGRHPFSYVPFSAGPRNCIGQKFAMSELKSLVGHILYNFNLEPIDRLKDIRILADIIMRPTKPVHLKFIRIDHE